MDEHTHDLNRRIAQARGLDWRWAADAMTIEYCITSTPPGVEMWLPLPDYAHDLNAAIRLLNQTRCEYHISAFPRDAIHAKAGMCEVRIYRDALNHHYAIERNGNLPEAICEAWLAWHAAKEAE